MKRLFKRKSLDSTIEEGLQMILSPSYVTGDKSASSVKNITSSAYSSATSDLSGYGNWLNKGSSLQYDNLDGGTLDITGWGNNLTGSDGTVKTPTGGSSNGGIDPITASIGGVIGIARDLLSYAHADKAAKVAYDRQNEFYDNHLSMPAKVQEFEEAGLNPMALGASGPGATSAPSVAQGETPGGSAISDFIGVLLNYKLKNRELDIADRRVDVDSRRVDLMEERLPSLIDQAFATAENKRKQNEWYDTAMGKMRKEVELMDSHIGKVFAETEKINAEAFILQIEGNHRDDILTKQCLNLAKDLDVKDSEITENYASAALSYAESVYKSVVTQYTPGLMSSQIGENVSQSQYNVARTAVEKFREEYREKHSGAEPPSGMIGAFIGIASQIARRIVSGVTLGYVNEGLNPNW